MEELKLIQVTIDGSSVIFIPNNPEKNGYTFGGWYSDAGLTQPYVFSTIPTQDITVYAKWEIRQQTITFNSNGGSTVAAITQNYGTTVSAPATPTKNGYTFGGWYSDAGLTQPYVFSTIPTQDITVYAKWEIRQQTITFNSNGGSTVAAITQNYGTTVSAPATPTKNGYTFWRLV